MTTCPLCGYAFDKTGMVCHTSCPLSQRCSIVCCPNCGFQMPDEDRAQVVRMLRRAWAAFGFGRGFGQNQPDPASARPLTALRVGEGGEVTDINTLEAPRLAYLSALGIVPGSHVTVCQRSLAYVVQVDETEIALDSQIANDILVRVGLQV